MYKKNLTEKINLRLSPNQLQFLAQLAAVRHCSTSDVVRDILDYYILEWEEDSVHGNKPTYINSQL